jgi:uncharacterized protein
MIISNRKVPLRVVALALVLTLLGQGAGAAVIAPRNLYEGEVLVDAKSPSPREALMRQALGQVLVRITGDREIEKRKAGIELMKLAPRLVQQYDYDRRPAPLAKGVVPTVPVTEIKVFRARFDARVVDTQLRDRGFPVWGRERPVTQVLLAVEEGGSRWFLTESIAAVEAPSLLQAALGRGVPIVLPAAAGANEVQDLLQGRTDGLVAAAKAAGHRWVLVGRVAQKGAQWDGSWTLFDGGQVQDRWRGTAANRDEALAFGIDQMANAYAARYAVRGGAVVASGVLRLVVSGIDSAAEYARVQKYLAGLSTVSEVNLVEMSDGRAHFDLKARGDRTNLQQSIALSSLLKPVDGPAIDVADSPLSYELVK